MAEERDLMALGREAMEEAKGLALDSVREMKASVVNSPAAGKALTRQERRDSADDFLASPDQMELEWQKLESRFQAAEPGMIPRRWLEYGLMIMKDRKQEAPDA